MVLAFCCRHFNRRVLTYGCACPAAGMQERADTPIEAHHREVQQHACMPWGCHSQHSLYKYCPRLLQLHCRRQSTGPHTYSVRNVHGEITTSVFSAAAHRSRHAQAAAQALLNWHASTTATQRRPSPQHAIKWFQPQAVHLIRSKLVWRVMLLPHTLASLAGSCFIGPMACCCW
jgi:hypothetical protein